MPKTKNKIIAIASLLVGVALLIIAVPQLYNAYRLQTSGEHFEVVPGNIENFTVEQDRPPLRSNKPFSGKRENVSNDQVLTFTYTDASGKDQQGRAWSRGHSVQPDQKVTVIQTGPGADDFVRFDFVGVWSTPAIWALLAVVALLVGIKQLVTTQRQQQAEEPATES